MNSIRVETTVTAPPERVWAALADLASHVEWMADAEAIRFTSDRTAGVGTTFECDTSVGPLRVTDVMEVTTWEEPTVLAVRHTGAVSGTGRFTLEPAGGGTRLTWVEELDFPLWMGGSVGGALGSHVMRRIWNRNLDALRARVEGG
ncbi:MAG: SRPBCC family protein [Acidimicrobiales bacterium]